MADADLLEQQPGKPAPATEKVQEKYRYDDFVVGERSGKKVTEGGRNKGEVSQNFELKPEVRKQYHDFLVSHIKFLLSVENKDILKHPLFKHDQVLINKLLTAKNGEEIDTSLIDQRVGEFLNDKKGLITTTLLLENQMMLKEYALGLLVKLTPSGSRNNANNQLGKIPLGWNRGRLRQFIDTIPGTQVFKDIHAGETEPLLSEGTQLEVVNNPLMFDHMKANPAIKEYIFELTNISLDDFRVSGGKVERIPRAGMPGGVYKSQRAIDGENGLRTEVIENFHTRNDFLDALHIDKDKRDGTPLQYLLNGSGIPEEVGLRVYKKVQSRIDEMGGMAGLTAQEQVLRRMRAQSAVMAETVQEYLGNQNYEDPNTKAIEVITGKIDARTNNTSKLYEKVNENRTDKKGLINIDINFIPTEEEVLDSYQLNLQTIDEGYLEFKMDYPTYGEEIDRAIADLNDKIEDLRNPASIGARKVKIETDSANAQKKETTAYLTSLAGLRTTDRSINDSITAITQRINAQREAKLKPIIREESEIEEKINKLKQLKKTIEDAKKVLAENRDASLNLDKKLEAMSFSQGTLNLIGLDQTFLATVSIDEIYRQINQRFVDSGGTEGWPIDQNKNPQKRKIVVQAVADAKAEELADLDGDRMAIRFTRYYEMIDPARGKLTPNQMRSMRIDDLVNLLGTNGYPLSPDEVREGVKEARDRVEFRQIAFKDLAEQFGEEQGQLTYDISAVEFKDEVKELETIRELLVRQKNGKINEDSQDIVNEVAKFTETGVIPAVDRTFTVEEKAVGAEQGYYAFMDLLFDYQKRSDRQEYFKKISKLVEPEDIARTLNTTLGLGLTTPTLTNVLTTLNHEITIGSIIENDVVLALDPLVTNLRNRALGMP